MVVMVVAGMLFVLVPVMCVVLVLVAVMPFVVPVTLMLLVLMVLIMIVGLEGGALSIGQALGAGAFHQLDLLCIRRQ